MLCILIIVYKATRLTIMSWYIVYQLCRHQKVQELFDDDRAEMPRITKDVTGPEILADEVRSAIRKLKKSKACGPDNISAEMLQAAEEFSTQEITKIANEIYNSGEIPRELLQSIFIALPKKPGAMECELHRTISLISVVIKVILRILMMRMRSIIIPEIGKVQCEFVKDSGTRNAIFILRHLCEKAIEVKKICMSVLSITGKRSTEYDTQA